MFPRETLSLCSYKFRHVNSKYSMARAPLPLKGIKDETMIGYPLLIKKIETTLLDHALGMPTVFSVIKLAKVDSAMP